MRAREEASEGNKKQKQLTGHDVVIGVHVIGGCSLERANGNDEY